MCDAATKKGCAKNEIAFIEKHEGKSADALKEVAKEKADELKEIRKARSEAESELKQKQREWKKRENALNRATNILKQMQKTASA